MLAASFWSVCRALLSVCSALLSVCRALLSVCRALLSVCRALLNAVVESAPTREMCCVLRHDAFVCVV